MNACHFPICKCTTGSKVREQLTMMPHFHRIGSTQLFRMYTAASQFSLTGTEKAKPVPVCPSVLHEDGLFEVQSRSPMSVSFGTISMPTLLLQNLVKCFSERWPLFTDKGG